MIASLILAVRFLTIVRVPGREAAGPDALGRAGWWFPAVGLGLGAVLAVCDRALAPVLPPLAAAAVLLALWKVLTGGIHLDGLADCLDGLTGRDPAHRRAIMKDSRVGAFGVVGLVLVLLLGLAALAELGPPGRGRVLLLAPAIGRLMPLVVGAWVPGPSPAAGLGAAFLGGLSRWAAVAHLAVLAALLGSLFAPWSLLLLLVPLGLVLCWSALLRRRHGGLTGDVLGSGVELGEALALLTGASLQHLGRLAW